MGTERRLEKQLGARNGPTGWNSMAGNHSSMRYLDIVGLRVKYKGPGSDDRDAASIRSNVAIPVDCPVYYFEVEITNKGRDGYIGIGLSQNDVKLDRLPGWEPHSYGYHGDDGHVFNGRGTGRPYGPTYTTGDWIGIIFNRIDSTISFTKRGFKLGVAFKNVPEKALYPTVGFRTPDEEIVVNFGQDLIRKPFKGNYEDILDDVTSNLYSSILSTRILEDAGTKDIREGDAVEQGIIGQLVFDYLNHHGYWETATAVAEDILSGKASVSESSKEESLALCAVTDFVMAGDIDKAIESAEDLCPGVLEKNHAVAFRLRCQKFCEMIKDGKDEEAIRFGRDEVEPLKQTGEDKELFDEALSLFAYSNPVESPSGYLLGTAHRGELAALLTRALRKYLGKREVSTLEELYRQACVVQQVLVEEHDQAASLLDVNTFVNHAGE